MTVKARVLAVRLAIAGIALIGLGQIGDGAYIKAKAAVAQLLLDRAWSDTRAGGAPVKPWPWADTWPVARLTAPELGVDLIVLEGVSGQALAFGPGRLPDLAGLGGPGTAIIAGHRDTHFDFLKDLETGHTLVLETADGRHHRYSVIDQQVLDYRHAALSEDVTTSRLVLVTCYPFDTLVPGGPLRYLVFTERAADTAV